MFNLSCWTALDGLRLNYPLTGLNPGGAGGWLILIFIIASCQVHLGGATFQPPMDHGANFRTIFFWQGWKREQPWNHQSPTKISAKWIRDIIMYPKLEGLTILLMWPEKYWFQIYSQGFTSRLLSILPKNWHGALGGIQVAPQWGSEES